MTLYLDLFNSLLPSAGLVLAAWLAMRMLRLNAATRYAAWWAVLALVLVLPFLAPTVMRTSRNRPPMVTLAAVDSPAVQVEPAATPLRDAPSTKTVEPEWSATDFIPPVYFGVLALLLFRLGADYLRVRRMVQTATPARFDCTNLSMMLGIERKTRVLVSGHVETPLVAGFLRPAIILPAALLDKLSDSELRHVIVHELAHIARRDDWTNLLGKLLQAICWPHPLVTLSVRCIDVEREYACDDWVVATTGGTPSSYAKSLTRLVELAVAKREPLLASTVIGQGPRVSKRVELLLNRTRSFAPRISLVKLGMSLVCLIVFGLICTQAPALVAMGRSENNFEYHEEAPEPQTAPRPPASSQRPSPVAPAPSASTMPVPPPHPPSALGTGERMGFLASLAAAGYKDLSVDEIIELKNNGVDGKFIQDMAGNGWGRLSPRQLIELHNNGVSGNYLRDMKAAGIRDLTLEKAIELRNHGVRADSITEIHSLGFGPYDLREILDMSNHGLRPSFFRGLKERGITQISARHAMEAASHGLTPQSIDEARKFGPNLSFEQILKLKRAGVI